MTNTYSIESQNRGGVEIYTLSGTEAVVEIAPALGNNCFSFRASHPVLEPVDFSEFARRPTSYGIPILFPFPNRIKDGKFSFQGRSYTVQPPRHGFVRDKAWTIEDKGASDEAGAWILSSLDAKEFPEEILNQFPFPFLIEMIHILKGRRLLMIARARNTGEKPMPVGYGIHPYFRRPKEGSITVPARGRWELQESLPTGDLVPLTGKYDVRHKATLTDLDLDDIFTDLEPGPLDTVECLLEDNENKVETVIEFSDSEFPNVVVYTPPSPRAAICIEPNTCPTDAFNLASRGIDSNILILEPGEACTFEITIASRMV